MKKRLDISIKNPCQENWATFEKKGDVGFCKKCQFSIIDLTNKTDREISEYLSKTHGKVCGLMRQDQLYYSHTGQQSLRKFAVIAAGLLTMTTLSKALPAKEINPSFELTIGQNVPQDLFFQQTLIAEKFRFFGTVVSQYDGSEIPGVNVTVKGTQNGTITDANGKFEIYIPGEVGDEITLQISFVGLKTIEKKITLTGDGVDLGKFVMVDDVRQLGEIRIPWWKRLWWTIKGVA